VLPPDTKSWRRPVHCLHVFDGPSRLKCRKRKNIFLILKASLALFLEKGFFYYFSRYLTNKYIMTISGKTYGRYFAIHHSQFKIQ
jgi:hypothetical protein